MLTIESAAELLLQGKTLIFPTDTVYGIGALASHPAAIERIYSLKQRSLHKPFIALIHALPPNLSKEFYHLAHHFWPGPLTLITNNRGYRMPDHPVALQLLSLVNQPILTTSANLSGQPAPISFEEMTIKADGHLFSDQPLTGIPSTVYDLDTNTLYRSGPIPFSQIEDARSRVFQG